jgi:hypothetical protein
MSTLVAHRKNIYFNMYGYGGLALESWVFLEKRRDWVGQRCGLG